MAEKRGLKDYWKKFWFLLWKDDSIKGWLFSIIFLFVFIRFVFFPILGFAAGTAMPLAIVESCSMYHDGNILGSFDSWWDRHEDKYRLYSINKTEFEEFPMKKGFNKGDILFITRANPDKLEVGDIIIFRAGQQNPIIHRIVDIRENLNGKAFSTIGDNNAGQFEFEKRITEEMLVGKAQIKVAPYFGWIKLIFFEWQKSDQERGLCGER